MATKSIYLTKMNKLNIFQIKLKEINFLIILILFTFSACRDNYHKIELSNLSKITYIINVNATSTPSLIFEFLNFSDPFNVEKISIKSKNKELVFEGRLFFEPVENSNNKVKFEFSTTLFIGIDSITLKNIIMGKDSENRIIITYKNKDNKEYIIEKNTAFKVNEIF